MGTEGKQVAKNSIKFHTKHCKTHDFSGGTQECPECTQCHRSPIALGFWGNDFWKETHSGWKYPCIGRSIKIQLDKYIFTMQMWKDQIKHFRDHPQIVEGINKKIETDVYRIFWGSLNEPTAHASVLETGFFWKASHLDTVGLYQHSSLCTPQALKEIENFDADVSASEIVKKAPQTSKYKQGEDNHGVVEWDGVVLALQNPGDRSIRSVASPAQYYEFVENACKHYGSDLFIKLHPWNSGEVGERLRAIAYKYGINAAKINHRIIEHCKFVLVFNSTFSVDCMLRNIPVAQYAPGYFYQNPAIKYTCYTFPNDIKTNLSFGQKTCDFLMWKYCFDHLMPAEKWIKMFNHFAKDRSMFPMPRELSYAYNKSRA